MHSASQSTPRLFASLLAALLMPGLVLAHPQGHVATDAWAGFIHPLTGIDHALAMIAVGLWAVQLGRAAIWILPSIFPLAMIGGALLARMGLPLPAIESMLALSVMSFGVAVAFGVRLPLMASALLVALFAVFHGYAHYSEAPIMAVEIGYGAGFIAATVLLHLIGVAGGALVARASLRTSILRWGGAVIASTGACLLMF